MSRIFIDLRYSVRTFLRAPALTAALILTIALGIGSNVAVQGFVRGLTRTGTPLKTPPNFVSVFVRGPYQSLGPASYADFQSLKTRQNSLEWIGAARITRVTTALGGRPSIVSAAAITPELASLLNLPLTQGGAVISHRLWRDELDAKTNIKDDKIRIGTETVRLAGIAPEDVTGIYDDIPIDLWLPFNENPLQGPDRTTRNLWIFGLLRSSGDAVNSPELEVRPFNGMTPEKADGLSRVGTVLRAAGACVFFIACANVAAFLIGRATDRSRETSLRVALGAGRRELAQAVLADSIVISLAGGALGALLSVWTSKILPVLLFEQDAERLTFASDPSSIAAASGICVGMTIVCGLLPLFAIPHNRPAAVLRREGIGPSKIIQGVRSGLVIAQMACCCLLVTSTGFLLESLHSAFRTTVTHGLGHPVLATVSAQPDVGLKYFQNVERAAQSVPNVSGMAWAGRLPGALPALQSFRIEPQRLTERDVTLDIAPFTSHSLELFVFPPKAGRMFSFPDPSCRVAVVNEEADKALFAGETAGRSIRDPSGRPTEIIGVLAARKGQAAAGRPTVYLYHADESGPAFDRIQMAHFRAPAISELSRSELDALLRGAMFVPEQWQRALYAPPVGIGALAHSGTGWERFGARFLPGLSGVHIVEVSKSMYAPATPTAPATVRVKAPAILKPAGTE